MSTGKRKNDHLEISLKEGIEFREKTTGLEEVGFKGVEVEYSALPEIDKKNVDTATEFLGKGFSTPILVEAITGGTKRAEKINKDIARACERVGLGMCLGSQRAMLEDEALSKTYWVRDVAPSIFLAGNIGAAQLGEYSLKMLDWAVKEIQGDALAIHLNAAQEAVQGEGTTNFEKRVEVIKKVAKNARFPVYVKEVGNGIGFNAAKVLAGTGVKAIDVGGAGGTSWTAIDSIRKGKKDTPFWDFGIPTAVSIVAVRKAFKGPIIASGGIRSGIDVVKSIVLGADMAGIALPVLKAQAKGGSKGVEEFLVEKIEETRNAMFLVGAENVKELKKKKYYLFGKTREWVEQIEKQALLNYT